ncbi:uncharacterized protein LOC128228797 [Mya arenaria]|uniref:uncharacterized protein LOC128228797 n=1 Tax=Mya arenaria TaxID=6604 RepID=UPI0022E2FDA6|nr:uncharacterized protein LOC128228797 [Mya arenaria]
METNDRFQHPASLSGASTNFSHQPNAMHYHQTPSTSNGGNNHAQLYHKVLDSEQLPIREMRFGDGNNVCVDELKPKQSLNAMEISCGAENQLRYQVSNNSREQDGLHLLADETKELKDKKKKDVLTEIEVARIARCIGRDWEMLASELGCGQIDIEAITKDNPNNMRMQIRAMLQEWKNRKRRAATKDALKRAICNCKSLVVNWDDLEEIIC